jgi:MFS transporter, PPP family, 3-phenylpropionic acid transporter
MEPVPARRPVAPSSDVGAVIRPAIVYAVLFGGVGAYVPYVAIYLRSTGFGLEAVGALIALHAAVSLVAAPTWGAIADGLGQVRRLILVAGVLSAIAAALLALAVGPLAVTLALALLAAVSAGVIPLVDSRTIRIVGQRERFGQARAWGSAAFIVVAFATSAAVARFGPPGMFVLYVPLAAATGVAGYALLRLPGADRAADGRPGTTSTRIRAGSAQGGGGSLAPIAWILRQPRIGVFFVATTVIWTSHAALQGFVSLQVVGLGGDSAAVAATWSIGALVEVPLMIAFPRLARRFGVERMLVIGAFAFAIRALASALVGAPWLIVAVAPFGGIGFAFVYVGTVSWVAGAVPREVQATAQGIFTGTANFIGVIAGSIVGGAIGGAFGLPDLFVVSAAGYAVGGLLVWSAIGRPGGPVRERGRTPAT